MKKILAILFLCFYVFGCSQKNKAIYPSFISQSLSSIESNSDWMILQKSSGDLNNDGFIDFAIILESKDSILEKRCLECKLLKNKPRIIVVLFNQKGKTKAIIQNNKFIARGNEGGMLTYLEPELSIENGLLTIYYQYTRSNQSYTFGFSNEQMEIVSAQSNGVHSASGDFENDKFDFKKREIISETGNISQEKIKTQIIKIDVKPRALSEFEKMYDWKITEHKYL